MLYEIITLLLSCYVMCAYTYYCTMLQMRTIREFDEEFKQLKKVVRTNFFKTPKKF